MDKRQAAIEKAVSYFDAGGYSNKLKELISLPSSSEDSNNQTQLKNYLEQGLEPWLKKMGFLVFIHDNPLKDCGPILTATRMENPSRPTILMYGHGDTVRGMEGKWQTGLSPWQLMHIEDKLYGRGTADNKGQHALNLCALEQILAERQGKLGFNIKLLIETSEEQGSRGLREFIEQNAKQLSADVLIASDGPRFRQQTPTIYTGTRGVYNFDLVVRTRQNPIHSGNWGGIAKDPAIILAHALSSICDQQGKIHVREWFPKQGVDPAITKVVSTLQIDGESSWGEPGCSMAERLFSLPCFVVLGMSCGSTTHPLNAISASALAKCQIRYTVDSDPHTFQASLRSHLDKLGFKDVQIENGCIHMEASRTDLSNLWPSWVAKSIEKTLGVFPDVIPNAGGSLPGNLFAGLGIPLIWIPHSYNNCGQHGPNEHLLVSLAREGMAIVAGIWWDLGEVEA